ILIQDYRFAFADLFLKSAIALLLLVSLSIAACVGLIVPLAYWRDSGGVLDPRATAVMVVGWVATAVTFPLLRQIASWLVDRVVLHRPDYDAMLASSAADLENAADESDVTARFAAAARAASGATGGDVIADPFPDADRRVVVSGSDRRAAVSEALSFVVRLR